VNAALRALHDSGAFGQQFVNVNLLQPALAELSRVAETQ
jgi:hypothetical protein